MKLHLASNFSLPTEAVTETFAILAKRGVGKTYTAKKLAEQMLKAAIAPVVIADPIGVWWGLRSSADGKGPGLPVLVLGGDYGDAPLEATAGEIVARMLVEERLSAVLDLSKFRKNEQTQFMTAFAERLYHQNREALHLMLDEADAFAPQKPYKGQERLLGAIEDLVRRGRARGIGVTLITQRAAVINKDVLTQAEVLVALRTIAPQDRAAIEAWIRVHGTEEQGDALMASLPSLPVGTAWFWSPGWLDVFQRVEIGRIETFDSSATPKAGAAHKKPKKLADVDIPAVRERLAVTIEKAKAEDPRLLRAEIARLTKELASASKIAASATNIAPVNLAPEQEKAARKEAARSVHEQYQPIVEDIYPLIEKLTDALQLLKSLDGFIGAITEPPRPAVRPAELPPAMRKRVEATRARQAPAPAHSAAARRDFTPPAEHDSVSRPQQAILDGLAWLEVIGVERASRTIAAFLANASPRSSGYENNVSRLRTLGLLDYPSGGEVQLTDAGRRVAARPQVPGSSEELHEMIYRKLPRPQGVLLRVLIEHYPKSLSRADLAEAAGVSAASSGYENNVSALSGIGLVEYPDRGHVRAKGLLFLEASRARA